MKGTLQNHALYAGHIFTSKFNLVGLKTPFLLSLILSLSLAVSMPVEAKKQKKDKIKVKILQNEVLNDCLYKGDVVIKVKYRLRTLDYGHLVAELSTDDENYFEVTRLDIERGKGKVIMSFDAGECASDLRVIVK